MPATPAGQFTSQEQSAITRRVGLRLMPLLFFCYVIAYVDRINVGFAKLHLQAVLGVDDKIFSSVFGFGAGLFFIGYFIFEVPSNLILHRIGARIWIARIMILWGLVSMAFMFLKGATMFYIMRFLLGAAEAGFFPGVILYLTYWYPPRQRAGMMAWFAVGGVAAGVIGSPISGAILGMNGIAGLAGWQWLFLLEGLPSLLLGFVILALLPNGPKDAKWLSLGEKTWIQSRLIEEKSEAHAQQSHTLAAAFKNPIVWLLCLTYFLLNIGSYGYEMWLPTILKALSGGSDRMVGWLNAIPYFTAGLVMLAVGRHSDKRGERRWHIALSAAAAAAAFALAAWSKSPLVGMMGLVIAFAGLKSTLGPFWALSTTFLSGTAAAGGIALINSVGNLGGFFGPTFVGMIKDKTGSDFGALLLLGGALLGMGLLVLLVPQRTKPVSPSPQP
jgi:sugar phosphate permease